MRGVVGIAQRERPSGVEGVGELVRLLLGDLGVRPGRVVVGAPQGGFRARLGQRGEQRLVEQFLAHQSIDGMDGPCTPASAWHNGGRCISVSRSLLQVHAADAAGRTIVQLKLRRAQVIDDFRALPPCLVGLEACATAHHWARELGALGNSVRLMPPAYVKPSVRRDKTDAADTQAIAEALTHPTMRFVPVNSADRQALLMLHRAREHLAEFGIIAPQGIQRVEKLAAQLHVPAVPPLARDTLNLLVVQLASTSPS